MVLVAVYWLECELVCSWPVAAPSPVPILSQRTVCELSQQSRFWQVAAGSCPWWNVSDRLSVGSSGRLAGCSWLTGWLAGWLTLD